MEFCKEHGRARFACLECEGNASRRSQGDPTQIKAMPDYEWSPLCATVAGLLPHLDWRENGLGVLQAYLIEGLAREVRVHVWSAIDHLIEVCRNIVANESREPHHAHNARVALRRALEVVDAETMEIATHVRVRPW